MKEYIFAECLVNRRGIRERIDTGELTQTYCDEAVSRVITEHYRGGWFSKFPYRVGKLPDPSD